MRQYRLITANSGLMSHLSNRPLRGFGWELRVEFHESGKVDDDTAVVLTPEGVELCRHRLAGNPRILKEIREVIQRDVQTASEPADTFGAPEQRPPLICVRVMPTGGILATLWLSGEEFKSSPGEMGPDDSRGISRGPTALTELKETLTAWKAAHPDAVLDSEVPLADLVGADATTLPPALSEMASVGQPQHTRAETIQQVPIPEITHFPGGNIRERFEDLDQLAKSIRHHGVLEPLIVNRQGGRYVLIAGERRLRAAGLAGLKTVPCRVLELNDTEALELMLIENIQRQDLNPIEEARAYQRLLALPGATQGSVAQRLGKPREYVNEMLRLLGLPPVLSQLVATGQLSRRAGLEFMRRTGDLPEETRQRIARSVAVRRPTAREMGPLLDALLAAEGVVRATTPLAPAAPPLTPRSPAPSPATVPPTLQTPSNPDPSPQPTAEASLPLSSPAPVERPQPAAAPPALATTPTTPATAAFEVDPDTAHRLATIGRRFWNIAPGDPWSGYDGAHHLECPLTYEAYLPLPRLLEFWEELQSIGATSIPRTIGTGCRINIPEHRLWIQQYDQYYSSVEFDLSPDRLRIKLSTGGVDLCYQGHPVYYRAELRATGATKYLRQQLVIPDGDRHIVLTGGGSVLLRRGLLKRWDALLRALPALEVSAHAGAGT